MPPPTLASNGGKVAQLSGQALALTAQRGRLISQHGGAAAGVHQHLQAGRYAAPLGNVASGHGIAFCRGLVGANHRPPPIRSRKGSTIDHRTRPASARRSSERLRKARAWLITDCGSTGGARLMVARLTLHPLSRLVQAAP